MLPGSTSCYRADGSFRPASVGKSLPRGYAVRRVAEHTIRGTLLDTFDGHLRRAQSVLMRSKGKLTLFEPLTGALNEQDVTGGWNFASEIGEGEVGARLLELTSLRAFRPVAEFELCLSKFAILDELEKTVARVSVAIAVKGRKRVSWISASGLKGYDDELQLLIKALKKTGCTAIDSKDDYFPMPGIGRELYQSRPAIDLAADRPIYESACTIVDRFLSVARKNEQGVKEDIDTEFIHDYRVSLRRVRSLLSLFRGVYEEDEVADIKETLGRVMKQTNPLRDLDVYLLDRSVYYRMVPDSMHPGLDIMFGVFKKERAAALRQVCDLFGSKAYDREMKSMQKGFRTMGFPTPGAAAGETTLHFAKRLILTRYRKITGIAGTIDASTPDETVHELRIQCKKLRYLMEFFLPLFPAKKTKPLIKALKGLQDVLGRFNDYSVQRETLSAFVAEHPMRGRKRIHLAESVGALVATLYQLQLKARMEVEAGLGTFTNDQTGRAFARLFSNKDK